MEPVFMFWDEIEFKGDKNFKEFRVTFENNNDSNGVIFKKEKNYFITSLTANIKIKEGLNGLKDYDKLKKISDVANEIEKKKK